jgi:hypothetical protein
MEITLTFRYGSLDIEIEGNKEEVENDLVEFVEFLQENEESLRGMEASSADGEETETEQFRLDELEEGQGRESETAEEDTDTGTSYGDIPNRTDLARETLSEYLVIHPEAEEPPYLDFDAEVLNEDSGSRSERQMRGSLILMTLWRECNGIEEVGSSELKNALRISGINDTNLYNMYQFNDGEGDRYFRREGSGASTDITLSMPGEREGFDQIERTIERLEEDEAEE